MATISNTPRPGYVWDATDNVWYPIGVGAHQHTNAADTPAVLPYSTYAAAGKNKVINGDFGVWQRGTSFSNPKGVFLADRFQFNYDGTGTLTASQQTFTPGTAPVSGYEGQYFLRLNQTVAGSGTNFSVLQHPIEDVRTFAGQTVTVSFWAKADASRVLNITLRQDFGTGGSTLVDTSGAGATLTTSWVRYTNTISVPSISGKTVGTSSSLRLFFALPLNTTQTIDIWGVQVEAGSNMTAFQTATGNPASELAACQRYYFRASVDSTSYRLLGQGTVTSVNNCDIAVNLPVQMRTIPASLETSAMSTFYYEPAGGSTPTSISLSSAATQNIGRVSVAKTSSFTVGYAIGLFSNNTPAYLGFSSEL
jgi:hypothetical protein